MSYYIRYPNSIQQWMLCDKKAHVNYFSTTEGLIGVTSCPRVASETLKRTCDNFKFYNKNFAVKKRISCEINKVIELIIILRDPYERLHSALQQSYAMQLGKMSNKKIEWNDEHYMPQAYFNIIIEDSPNKTFFYYNKTIIETIFAYLIEKYKFPSYNKPIRYYHKSEITYDKSLWKVNYGTQKFFEYAKEVYAVDETLISNTHFYNYL